MQRFWLCRQKTTDQYKEKNKKEISREKDTDMFPGYNSNVNLNNIS